VRIDMSLFVPGLCTTNDSEQDEGADGEEDTMARKPVLPKGIKLKVRMSLSCVLDTHSVEVCSLL
jgi:hypothetical protein